MLPACHFNICRTNASVYSFPPECKTCKGESAQTSPSSNPRHTLRSFNYLMQDAGIMLGRHLKAAPAFIYWDGSSVRRKEKRSARVAPSLFMVSSKAHSSTTPSFSVFGIPFLCLFWLLGNSALHISTFCPLHRGGTAAPKGTWSHRQGWQVNLKGGHNSNFTFQHLLFTGLSLRDPLEGVIFFWCQPFEKAFIRNTTRTWNVTVGCTPDNVFIQ